MWRAGFGRGFGLVVRQTANGWTEIRCWSFFFIKIYLQELKVCRMYSGRRGFGPVMRQTANGWTEIRCWSFF
jgi:hypothetical protein